MLASLPVATNQSNAAASSGRQVRPSAEQDEMQDFGADLGPTMQFAAVTHSSMNVPLRGGTWKSLLPFDVNIHQAPNGRRYVLGMHRLLMPDVKWIKWMRSDEALPRVWVFLPKNMTGAADSLAHAASAAGQAEASTSSSPYVVLAGMVPNLRLGRARPHHRQIWENALLASTTAFVKQDPRLAEHID